MRKRPLRSRSIWAYAYVIVPALTRLSMKPMRAILDGENAAALDTARIWNGRVVCDRCITHVLIVSDSPAQEGEINRRIEAEVELLEAQCFLTQPMASRGYPDGIDVPNPRGPARN
jgi:hypothetical protein